MKLNWDAIGEREYETGVDRGVLFPMGSSGYAKGVAWNGLSAVNESPEGAEPTEIFADNIKYLVTMSTENYKYSIEAYTYPDEFAECDGSVEIAKGVRAGQQTRRKFGFAYRTIKGNDSEGDAYGYIIHLAYGSQASPSEKGHSTVNDSPEAVTFSWEVSTTPLSLPSLGIKPTASLEIDSTTVDPAKLAAFEAILYGSDETEPRLPMPEEIAALFAADEQPEG